MVGSFLSEFFGIGTTSDFFHVDGIVAVCKDRLNNLVSDGVILQAVYFSILAEMPSWPLALDTSRDASRS